MRLTKFLDPLPIPPRLQPKTKRESAAYYQVQMKPLMHSFHREMKDTYLWGYNGCYPGPTIEVERGEHVFVKWINELPTKHFLPVDKTVHGCEPPNPEVRTVVHVHGGKTEWESDGYPEAWFTNGFRETGPFFTQKVYHYANPQRAATLWYHDHAVGITRLNVYAGLAGFYLIHDQVERSLGLPDGSYDIPLLIQDRSFREDGSLFYPSYPKNSSPPFQPSIVPEFFGNTVIVNGKAWPFLEVEPRKYRFRLINGSNGRFYRLRLNSGQSFYQIGTDGGLMEIPVELKAILLAPAERIELIIDFSNYVGKSILLTNDAPAPFPGGDPVDEHTSQVLQFRVTRSLTGLDTSVIPTNLTKIKWFKEQDARRERNQTLVEKKDQYGRNLLLLNGRRWFDPIATKPKLGTTEIWNLINLTNDAHPIHLHLVHFQILGRRSFDVKAFSNSGTIRYTGPLAPPLPQEKGWMDTVVAYPGKVTRIIAQFGPYPGYYVWHCHILEHEDHDMMLPYEVVVLDR